MLFRYNCKFWNNTLSGTFHLHANQFYIVTNYPNLPLSVFFISLTVLNVFLIFFLFNDCFPFVYKYGRNRPPPNITNVLVLSFNLRTGDRKNVAWKILPKKPCKNLMTTLNNLHQQLAKRKSIISLRDVTSSEKMTDYFWIIFPFLAKGVL